MQTQIRGWLLIWTLFSTNCKATVWQMKELKPYLSIEIYYEHWNAQELTEKSTSQQQFPIFTPELSKKKRSVELLSRTTRKIDFKTASSLAVYMFVNDFHSIQLRHFFIHILRCALTNRFHVAVRLFSNRSQMTSKCGKNKKVAHEA